MLRRPSAANSRLVTMSQCFHTMRLRVLTNIQDGFRPANAWVANGIAWVDDIQQFYRERSTIEKEYSARLKQLAKKYFEKKTKKSASLSVGDTPAMTPGSLER